MHIKWITVKNTNYSVTSEEWTLINIVFIEGNNSVRLVLDQTDTAHADMCFSNIMITHSVPWWFWNNHFFSKQIKESSFFLNCLFDSILDYKKILLLVFTQKNGDLLQPLFF